LERCDEVRRVPDHLSAELLVATALADVGRLDKIGLGLISKGGS